MSTLPIIANIYLRLNIMVDSCRRYRGSNPLSSIPQAYACGYMPSPLSRFVLSCCNLHQMESKRLSLILVQLGGIFYRSLVYLSKKYMQIPPNLRNVSYKVKVFCQYDISTLLDHTTFLFWANIYFLNF